jgi:ribosomal protein S6--L-glutamate ligase
LAVGKKWNDNAMIVSFHPLFAADKNIICAGRLPNAADLAFIKAAAAVILPQGCSRALYEMAQSHCDRVFPNYHARFTYPGKIGQIQLFRKTGVAHPATAIFKSAVQFHRKYDEIHKKFAFALPLVFKFDWGGEGDTVFRIDSLPELNELLDKAAAYEKSGQRGFLIQEYIPDQNRTLRVVIIGRRTMSYWRVRQTADSFRDNLAKGAVIDAMAEPRRQQVAKAFVKEFCDKTGINLAGLDVIFSSKAENSEPMLLEINYFFGRKGLGGSAAYYRILLAEIRRWLKGQDLSQ